MKRLVWFALLAAGCGSPQPIREMKSSQDKKPDPQEGRKILAVDVVSKSRSAAIPWEDPAHASWKELPATVLKLIPQQVQEPMLAAPTIGELRVRSVHNGSWVAVHLDWADASRNETLRSDRFGDAVAVELPIALEPVPDYRMGDEGRPVHLMLWRAERQRAIETKESFAKENYPNAWSDTYIFEPKTHGFEGGSAIEAERKRCVGAEAAGNPSRLGTAPIVEELSAQTWNKLSVQASHDARGRGVWADGRWNVVIAWPLVSGDRQDVDLGGKTEWLVAFAAWDGGSQNAGPRKMVTEGWARLKFAK